MAYETELRFMQSAFEKSHLQLLLMEYRSLRYELLDRQLRLHLDISADYELVFGNILQMIHQNVIYKLTDQFLCTYLFMIPPHLPGSVLFVGPFLHVDLSQQQIFEQMEKNGISPQHSRLMQDYYATLPVLDNRSPLFDMLEAYANMIWGGSDNYTVVDLNQELAAGVSPILRTSASPPRPTRSCRTCSWWKSATPSKTS